MTDRLADSEIEKFKTVAQKIDLDLDACEFKGGSFLREIQEPNVKSVDWLFCKLPRWSNRPFQKMWSVPA